MPARTENADQRWRFNNSGQLVDAEAAPAGWELADEIVRLKIGDVASDRSDIIPIRTPPKSKLVNGLGTDSPLDVASAGSSPHSSEHHISHSRASSIDTTNSSSHESTASGRLLNQSPGDTISTDAKERPHSFSGGISPADLHRLQQEGPDEFGDRQQQWVEQPSYPSLSNYNHVHRPQPQQHPSMYDMHTDREDQHTIDYIQSRNYNHAPVHHPSFASAAPANDTQPMNYRQNPRGFAHGASPLPYPGHTSHLSLGNTQHLYDMMLPAPIHDNHPSVTRVQQQHNVFRATHHHSASDPSNLRDAAALALLSSNMAGFPPAMFQPGMAPVPVYPNQYYGQDMTTLMAARLQAQYTGPYNLPPGAAQPQTVEKSVPSPPSVASNDTGGGQAPGPSANNRKLGLYKTELCRSWEEKGSCRYGAKCQFAHGEDELRKVQRHPKYKTEICRTFWVSGSCPYGKRCCFIHTELPSSGATPPSGVPSGADSSTSQPDGRARSMSTNSDPNDASTSLLARIKNNAAVSTPIDSASNGGFQFGSRPPTGSLRVDTSALDGPSISKQNKSAYPTFTSNGILLPAPEPIRAKSPAPVTAGPDLGRYNAAARLEIVGFNGGQPQRKGHATGNPRHSFSGEVDLGGLTPTTPGGLNSGNSANGTNGNGLSGRVNGHVRAGSAGNWGSLVRSNLTNGSFGRGGQHSPAGDIMSASPWSSGEMAAVRLHEKAWA
ncbi:hypothetical protein EST38_g5873 [Candolleomyces aberdarensis]|uniref:C3H1-type domain-containing protein n=1 Tax=Candolleomyces aberdarensis TaxID=2316362 RepID=A0A4Q2DLG2_9AGAR|nr:hypothetical protein EST38_g5873 [Candolleomyces aberdarensis]